MKEVYTITEASKALKVSRETLYKWIAAEKIKYNVLPSGKKRIPKAEIEKYTK